MGLPDEPVTLSPAAIEELHAKLIRFRHDVNNQLSLIIAASELIRRNPSVAERMFNTLAEQPQKIMEEVRAFSDHLEALLRIKRDGS